MTTDQRTATAIEVSPGAGSNGSVAAGRPHDGALRHSPHPVVLGLPGIYQDDHLVDGICSAADAALAPIFAILDDFAAYLDPGTTPEDMLGWLAEWIGAILPASTDAALRRQALHRAAEYLPWHGTAYGIYAAVSAICGVELEIDEPGATGWTLDPDTPLPGTATDRPVRVEVSATAATSAWPETVDSLLKLVTPAHIPIGRLRRAHEREGAAVGDHADVPTDQGAHARGLHRSDRPTREP